MTANGFDSSRVARLLQFELGVTVRVLPPARDIDTCGLEVGLFVICTSFLMLYTLGPKRVTTDKSRITSSNEKIAQAI